MLILICGPSKILIIDTPAGEQIEFMVLSVKGNQVRTGTVAPDNISIVREELYAPAIT